MRTPPTRKKIPSRSTRKKNPSPSTPLTVFQPLTRGGLGTNPGPILTHGRKALTARSSPPKMARTPPSVRRAVATHVSAIAAILWPRNRQRNALRTCMGPKAGLTACPARFRVEKPLGPSGSGGFSLSPRWPTVLRWRCCPRCSRRIGSGGWSVGQAAWRLGVSLREYRELNAGARSLTFETWNRICKLYGWPQTFVRKDLHDASRVSLSLQ